ncbi:hypothetical protein HK097_002976 [Rhizophlyctis rosea]|uniref:Uncharacterized protein n=1 Tax=Rhizophlyctis rosea TaxID=64517 RepID=A0AAD5X3Y6_9FUNG|nr:hypothetical protein HK097_002976 [Rhizophlyctis rosea]
MLLSSASQPDVRDFKASEYPSKTRKNRCASYDYCGTKTAQDIQNLHLDELIAIGKARDQQNEMSGVGEEGVRSREGSQEVVVAEMWRDGRERRSLSLVSAGREREESVPVHDAVRVVKVEVDSEEEL